MKLKTLTLLFALGLGVSLQAAPVRISFLDDETTLRKTIDLLSTAGCKSEGLERFKLAVDHYYASPFKLDRSKFPVIRDGFYTFSTVSQLIAAIPHRLCETAHSYEVNCFDTALLLTQSQLRVDLHADENAGPIITHSALTNGESTQVVVAKPTDAFELAYPDWYRTTTEYLFPKSLADARPFLTASMFRYYVLPLHTPTNELTTQVLKTLELGWKRLGFEFPTNCELVLCHQVKLSRFALSTGHAGVLFNSKTNCVYIEKLGGSGPFVRFDFQDRSDLHAWLASQLRGELKNGYTHFFATFNRGVIQRLRVAPASDPDNLGPRR